MLLLNACKKHDHPNDDGIEGKYVNLLISDQANASMYYANPLTGTITTHPTAFANSTVYTNYSGRYAVVINSTGNSVTFFDSGIEGHNDHIHVKGLPKWALAKGSGIKPVHYYGRDENMLIFNDGEGTLSHFNENTLHTEANPKIIQVSTAHHGAPALFNNGTIVVTEKDGTVSGTLPEKVKIIGFDGNTLHAATTQTEGIHGEASDGEIALFGSKNGILKVQKNGAQALIAYPASLGTNWLGSVYYGEKSKSFVGFRSKVGIYKIDPEAKAVTAVEENDKIFSIAFDWAGEDIIVLYTDGAVKILDGKTFAVKVTKNLDLRFPEAGATLGNPVMAASDKNLYITDGVNGKLLMYKKSSLELIKTMELPGKPSKMAFVGSMADAGHD